MNKHAGIHPRTSPWRQPPECSQAEQVRAWRDPDERVFLAAFWSWRLHAACRGVDTDLFYAPEGGERGRARAARERAAKAICATCPVKAPCAAYALQHHERYGIWGGLTESERASRWSRAAAEAPSN
jgi:WhiB family redox-sensing transcriptional regulator